MNKTNIQYKLIKEYNNKYNNITKVKTQIKNKSLNKTNKNNIR